MRAVLLVDEELYEPADPNFSKLRPKRFFDTEFYVSGSLRTMGYEVIAVPATADLVATLNQIKSHKPRFVFNLVEHVGGHRTNDSVVPSMLEVEGIPYTGASAPALMLARDKYLSKIVVASAGVCVPASVVINSSTEPLTDRIKFPAILKPLKQDGSEGISAKSYVTNDASLRAQLRRLAKSFAFPVICEEFIEGRDIIVTLSGIDRISVDSVRELVFPPNAPLRFGAAKIKFDLRYRKRRGIHYRTPHQLVSSLGGEIERVSRAAYAALDIDAYGKLDFRVRGRDIVFLEANPNSALSRKSATTDFRSIGYDRFIRRIVRLAFQRHARRPTLP